LNAFPYFEHFENIAVWESQLPPPPLQRTEIYSSPCALLSDVIAELWESDAQGRLEMNLQNSAYYLFATCEEYKYIHCGFKTQGLKTYYNNLLKEENTCPHFPIFIKKDGVYELNARMPDDQALGEWKLHTLKDMRWNPNHHRPIKYWSQDIIKSMR
jgi:protocatechuate 3,4-dioxygenase beta subunit